MLLDGIPLIYFTLKVRHHAGRSLTSTIVEAGDGSVTGSSAVTTGSLGESVSDSFGPSRWSSANWRKVVGATRSHTGFLRPHLLHILGQSSVLLLDLSNLWSAVVLVDVILSVFQNGVFFLSEVSFHLNTLVKLFESHIVNSFRSSKTSDLILNKERHRISAGDGLTVFICNGSIGNGVSYRTGPGRVSGLSKGSLDFPYAVLRTNGTLR
jgi:hypothetical protein